MARKVGFERARSWLGSFPIFTRFGLIVATTAWIPPAPRWISSNKLSQSCQYFGRTEIFTRAVAAPLEFELAFGEAFWADKDLPGNADQVRRGEFGPCTLVGVIVEDLNAPGGELTIELFAGAIGVFRALLQIQDHRLERSDRLRPFDAGIVVTSLDNGT